MGNNKMKFVNLNTKVLSVIMIAIISLSLGKSKTKIVNHPSFSRVKGPLKPSTNFMECNHLGAVGTVFKADCVMDDGAINRTEVNLQNCVGNNDGHLVNPSGKYYNSCKGCVILPKPKHLGDWSLYKPNDHTHLECGKCGKRGSGDRYSSISLSFLKVVNGAFTNCGTAINTILEQPRKSNIINEKMERNPWMRRKFRQ